MCGIVGIITKDGSTPDRRLLEAMTARLAHRGPDAQGIHCEPGLGLGHRRLKVIDMTSGDQPMEDVLSGASNRLVYNGEVFNYRELRRELEDLGIAFHSRSDTEVVLKSYRVWGDDMLTRFNGQLALGLWDGTKRRLLLARDRMGQKPLYYFQTQEVFVFASELKALLLHPACPGGVSPQALLRYLMFEYVPAPWVIRQGIAKLEPAQMLSLDAGTWRTETRYYWRIPFPEERGSELRSIDEAAEELREALDRAVQRRLLADVPLGIFLSGGLDSSLTSALAVRHHPADRTDTFCIGFEDPTFDESRHAALAARELGLRHHLRMLQPDTVWHLLGNLSDLLDEPLADASVVPTYLLAQFARQHVTVALGGDGGDELFAGYPTFQAEAAVQRFYRHVPRRLHGAARSAAACLPVSFDNISFDFKIKQFLKGAKIPGLARHLVWLGSFDPQELTDLLTPELADMVRFQDVFEEIEAAVDRDGAHDPWDRLMAFYARYYLAEDILVKVDRASMAVGLEARAPFLDPEVVGLAANIPPKWRLSGTTTKAVVKRAARGLVPDAITSRPKKGFGIPVAKWLLSELRPLAERLLDPDRISSQGLFNPWEVRRLLQEHLARRADNRKKLWTLMAFQLWWESYASDA